MMSRQSADAVVVGGGLIGSSIPYHLARAGVRTLLIEQGDLTSGANFGNMGASTCSHLPYSAYA